MLLVRVQKYLVSNHVLSQWNINKREKRAVSFRCASVTPLSQQHAEWTYFKQRDTSEKVTSLTINHLFDRDSDLLCIAEADKTFVRL